MKPPPGNANLPIGAGKNNHANQEIGVPGNISHAEKTAPPLWHSRWYLPHFDDGEAIQHVTWHLADSLPKEQLLRLEEELNTLPPDRLARERRMRLAAWLDAGYGACDLKDPTIAEMVQNTFLYRDAQRYRLLAWVVMPNHVHVLFQPLDGWTVAKIVASWKKFTAKIICAHRREKIPGNANLSIGASTKTPGRPPDPIWHREYWDRYIRNQEHLAQAIDYIHQNPVKAGLVTTAEDWQWSSAFPRNPTPPSRSGNANLPIGAGLKIHANREIGVPGEET